MNEIFNEQNKSSSLAKLIEDKHEIENNVLPVPPLLIINNDSVDSMVGSTKSLSSTSLSSIHPFINLENSFIITSQNGVLGGKILSGENNKQNIVKFLEPPSKRQKQESDEKMKELLLNMRHTIMTRLEAIEKKVEQMNSKYQSLEEKVDGALLKATRIGLSYDMPRKGRSKQIVLGIPVETGSDPKTSHLNYLNCEEAYPNGSWLGNPNSPNCRVRCDILPEDLNSINETCTTPEKMALTLLDYLFDRETQACSNISGAGKHGKMQLDPLKIFGIRCHLTDIFGITEKQWHKIKQNIDSKCRTAFRRKQRGMPLTVKGFKEKSGELQESLSGSEECSENSASALLAELTTHQPAFISIPDQRSSQDGVLNQSESIKVEIPDIIHATQGNIHVIRATLEQ